MNKSEVRIFIVDDDPSISKGIAEVVKRLGFQALVFNKPEEAQAQFRIQGCQLFIIDCLLPKIPGIDLALNLRADGAKDTPIILISGIYKDKGFIKDALRKTGAKAYLTKPFDIKELERLINQELSSIVDLELAPLENLMVNYLSPGERIKAINELIQIEAYELPWVCSSLMLPAVSGTLELKSDQQQVVISFSQGDIIQIQMKSDRSFFGQLLIENGFLTQEQLETALAHDSGKKLGEKLVDLNMLSPHIIEVINAEQSAIRLSLLLDSQVTYQIQFHPKEFIHTAVTLNAEKLSPYIADWIHSKFSPEWLKQHYMKWADSPTVKTGKPNYFSRLFGLPPISVNKPLLAEFESGQSLHQVLGSRKYPEDLVYQVFHLLILTEHIKMTKETKVVSEAAQISRLQGIWDSMQTQDYFAMLGLARRARAADVKKTYYGLAKIFHPDKLPANASKQLRDITEKVFGQLTKAYETIADDTKRTQYLKEIETGQAEKVLQVEALLEEGKTFLKSGMHQKAREVLERAVAMNPPTSDLLIHLAWARLAGFDSGKESAGTLSEVESTLGKIPPEDRHNATYYFVKGLYQKLTGDFAAAKKNIQHSLFLAPRFTEALRVLRLIDINAAATKPTSILHADLKDVVGSLFRKK